MRWSSQLCPLPFGFIDAGYSRDWSRIGAISEQTEEGLRGLAVTLGELHVAAAAAAGAVAAKRGLPVVWLRCAVL